MTGLERVRTAYHEAGHAVVHDALGIEVESVSIHPDGHTLGRVQLVRGGDAIDMVVALLAGRIAEESCPAGPLPTGDRGDWRMIDSLLDSWVPDPIDQYRLWQKLDRRARELVAQEWSAIERVAELLLECEEIDGERVSVPHMKGRTIRESEDREGAPSGKAPQLNITPG
jgi:ATP-dependent Zn protease